MDEKKTYRVIVHYEGSFDFDIVAENEDKAKELAMVAFEDFPAIELEANISDSFVCDCWEKEEEGERE